MLGSSYFSFMSYDEAKKRELWVKLHREQSHLRNTVWRAEQVILSMTKDAGSKFIPHDSCSYFRATEYLLRREFIFVDKCILQRGDYLKSIFGKQTYWRKNKTDCILYFSKELDFLFIREMFSFASAATWEHSEKTAVYEAGSRPSPDYWVCKCLNLGCLSPQKTVRSKCLLSDPSTLQN